MTTTRQLPDVDLLGALARAAADGLPSALGVLVAATGARAALVRDAADALLAVAGDAACAVPAARPADPEQGAALPLPGTGCVLVLVPAPTPELRPLLGAAASVLALAVRPSGAQLLADADAEGDRLADALHDGPVQLLVAARYACDAAARGGDPGLARAAVQDALVGLRRTLWHLRGRAGAPLPESLTVLSARRVEAGDPPLDLSLDGTEDLPPAARTAAHRLVQETAPHAVVAERTTDGVVLRLLGARPSDDRDRWSRRARLAGGALSDAADGLHLHLPTPPAPAPAPGTSSETKAPS